MIDGVQVLCGQYEAVIGGHMAMRAYFVRSTWVLCVWGTALVTRIRSRNKCWTLTWDYQRGTLQITKTLWKFYKCSPLPSIPDKLLQSTNEHVIFSLLKVKPRSGQLAYNYLHSGHWPLTESNAQLHHIYVNPRYAYHDFNSWMNLTKELK